MTHEEQTARVIADGFAPLLAIAIRDAADVAWITAIEEAARMAERHFIPGHAVAGPVFAAKLAARIRALVRTPPGPGV